MREIHFYSGIQYIPKQVTPLVTYDSVKRAIEEDMETIHTTQMVFLTSDLWYRGYEIHISDMSGSYILRPGAVNERTPRHLGLQDDLLTMWQNGEFDVREDYIPQKEYENE